MIEALSHFRLHSNWVSVDSVCITKAPEQKENNSQESPPTAHKIYTLSLVSPDEGRSAYPRLPGSISYLFSWQVVKAPVGQLIKVVLQVIISLGRFLSLHSVWSTSGGWKTAKAWTRWGEDGLRVVLSPVFYLGFCFLSWYGLHRPMDGTHALGTLEKSFYDSRLINPDFQSINRVIGSDLSSRIFPQCARVIESTSGSLVIPWKDRKSNPVTIRDFNPWISWERVEKTTYEETIRSADKSLYYGKSADTRELRGKFFLLILYGSAFQSIALIANGALRALSLITLSHFWAEREGEGYQLVERVRDAGKDLLRIVGIPVGLVAFVIIPLFGLLFPYDARHLYATMERTFYGEGCQDFGDGNWTFGAGAVIAPCMQPLPTKTYTFTHEAKSVNHCWV